MHLVGIRGMKSASLEVQDGMMFGVNYNWWNDVHVGGMSAMGDSWQGRSSIDPNEW